ncbi:MAG: sugar ABC transporter ATP-binding protein [Phycisphaerales bacterium]
MSKLFPGVRALDGVDFELRRGEVHALLGENGAGKSTLIKVLTGVEQPDGGTIAIDGRAVLPQSPREAERLGISTVYQEVNLVPQLSVAENICMGRFPTTLGFVRWRKARAIAEASLQRLGIRIDVGRSLSSYSIALQQMVAIARAVGETEAKAKVLILDEPTSSLDADEVSRLFAVMEQLRSEGLGIVFVTHFLEQVYRISDRITVLRNGKRVGQWAAKDLPRLSLIGAMVGKELSPADLHPHNAAPADDGAALSGAIDVRGLGKRGLVEPVTFDIPRGGRVGLAGLLGSGRTETARLMFGSVAADAGAVEINGKERRFRSPRQAIRAGVAMSGEDRKADGIFPNLSIRENITVALQARRGIWRRIDINTQRDIAARSVGQLNIRTPDASQRIGALSGGNQQKCLLARWLATEPALLILDEPTRGIDVGAKAEIRKLIDTLCEKGMSVLFISSELEEVADVCDRVVVLRDRVQVGELRGEQITPEAILKLVAQSGAHLQQHASEPHA